MQIAARDPTATLKITNRQNSWLAWSRGRFRPRRLRQANSSLATFIRGHCSSPTLCRKEIVSDHAFQFAVQSVELCLMGSQSGRGQMLGARLFANATSQTIELSCERRKLFITRFAERANDFCRARDEEFAALTAEFDG